MENDTIIGVRRGNMFKTYSFALITVIAVLVILYFIKLPLLQQPGSLSFLLIFFSIFLLLPFVFAFLKFIDKNPLLILSREGLLIRKSRLPFSNLEHIDWNDIARYSALPGGNTNWLVVERRSTKKKYYVDLLDLDTTGKDVLAALKRQAPNASFEIADKSED